MNTVELMTAAAEHHARGDVRTAVRLYERAARRGNNTAQFAAAQLYESRGEPFHAQARHWYSRAARAGNMAANARLYSLYRAEACSLLRHMQLSLGLTIVIAVVVVVFNLANPGSSDVVLAGSLAIVGLLGGSGLAGLLFLLAGNLFGQLSCALDRSWLAPFRGAAARVASLWTARRPAFPFHP